MVTALAIAGALLCATMVRFAPGYAVDERELDPRFSPASRDAIRSEHQMGEGLLSYYGGYVAGLVHGHFGISAFLQRPVGELLKERAPFTARAVFLCLLTAWFAATALSLLTVRFPSWALDYSTTAVTGFLIALPAAVVALLFVFLLSPVFLAIWVVRFPKLFSFHQHLLV